MYTPENAYAIGPSLHDETRELYELQENARTAQEEACKADFEIWTRITYCDRAKREIKSDIEEMMNSAMDSIFGNDQEAEKFRNALFRFYCSNDHAEDLREMIGKHLLKSYALEWEYD